MANFAHLSPETSKLMTLPSAERVQACEMDHWVGYSRAIQVLDHLDNVMTYPRSLRMPNVLVVGRSGNGKSAIRHRFVHRYPIQITEQGEAVIPLVDIEVPGTPDESEIWSEFLLRLGIAHSSRDTPTVKLQRLKQALIDVNARVLVIDEFNNFTRAGKAAGDLLASLKNLSNVLNLSVVAFGTQEAINALNTDPHMKSRFDPLALDRWLCNVEYRRFLTTYERLLPLAEPSKLASPLLATQIHYMAGDTIGGTVKLLKRAAAEAIRNGIEKIDTQLLDTIQWTRTDDWDQISRRV